MQMQTVELRCPYCHAAHGATGPGQHCCEYCLRSFTAIDAGRALEQRAEQAGAWLRARVGAGGEAEVIDQASRSYIFHQRILPELRRDAARAREGLGAWMQAPLIVPELARAHGAGSHPLLAHRGRMQALVGLRGRLEHDEVRRFAVDDAARDQLAELGRPIDELIHLINVVEAGQASGADRWRAVSSNLEALAEQVASPATSTSFAALQRERWRALATLAGHYDDCAAGRHPPGQLEVLEASIADLASLAGRLREHRGGPIEARASALAVEREVAGARLLATWLRCRERLPRASALDLPRLYETLAPLLPRPSRPERVAELLEGWTGLAAVARQEATMCVIEDFAWADAWAADQCRRRRFGLFGEDERVETIERFLVPVWIIELRYSEQRGVLLGSGVEQRSLGLLDACTGGASQLAVFDRPPEQLRAALAHPRLVGTAEIALPEMTRADAEAVFRQALGLRPELRNTRFEVHGLALVPAVTVGLRTRTGRREVTGALHGAVPTSARARERLDAGRWLFHHFAR